MGWGLNIYELVRMPIKRACNIYYLRWWYNGWHYWAFLPGKYTVVTEGENYRTIGTRKIGMSSGQVTLNQAMAIRTILNTREVYLLTIAGWMNIRIEPGNPFVYNNMVAGQEIEIIAIIGSKEITYTSGFSPVEDVPIITPPEFSNYCETIIGTQIWMCKNWDANYPNSKVYNNDEANRAIYGGLYTWDQVMSPGFCPVGWHIPSLGEWLTLINYLGGSAVAGGHLKEAGFIHWSAPNTGADNSSGFTALGAGEVINGSFSDLHSGTWFWTTESEPALGGGTDVYVYSLGSGSAAITQLLINPVPYHFSVRLIKDNPAPPVIMDDWYLPSRDELELVHDELYLYGLGNLNTSIYWSSSEGGIDIAWGHQMDTDTQSAIYKYYTYLVRACRAFTSTHSYSVRDIGPSGGFIFYKNGNDYIELAPTDLSSAYVWSNIDNLLIGTTGTAVGTGQANTLAIIGQAGHIYSAAKLCNDLVI